MTIDELVNAIEEIPNLYKLREGYIRSAYAAGKTVSEIAIRFNMKQPNVSKIIRNG